MRYCILHCQQTRDIEPMLFSCWSTVFHPGLILKHYWFTVSCLLGSYTVYIWSELSLNYGSQYNSIHCKSCVSVLSIVYTYQTRDVHLMSVQCRRRWPNIKPTSAQRPVFAGYRLMGQIYQHYHEQFGDMYRAKGATDVYMDIKEQKYRLIVSVCRSLPNGVYLHTASQTFITHYLLMSHVNRVLKNPSIPNAEKTYLYSSCAFDAQWSDLTVSSNYTCHNDLSILVH